jgi:hypothetical protein
MLHHDNALVHASLLIHEFFNKHEATVVTLQIWPLRTFLVPEVEILTKRSPISDGRGDRRKFDTRLPRHSAKHAPVRVPELEKNLGAVFQEWMGVL